MKILYISNSRIPTEKAHGIQIINMCQAFADQGVEVKLVLPARKNKQFKNISLFKYYQVKQNFKIKKIKSFDPNFLIKFPTGVYIKSQAFFFIISLFLYLLFKKNKQDYIFYTRDEYLLPLLQLFSKKVVWESHALPNHPKRYLKYWYRCYKIITISQGLKVNLIKASINKNKISIAHDAVNLNKFKISKDKKELRQQLDLPQDKKIIIYTGHLYEWKGAQVLASAAQYLSKNEIIVFVGGTVNDVKSFSQKNIKFIKSNKILMIGYTPHENIPLYLKAADILILPNTKKDPKANWTSPMKLFEYMASGIPIVAADLDVIKEILNDNSAMFFEADNPKNLSKKIKLLLQDNGLSGRLSQQALLDVQNYTWQKRVEKIINFIKQ